MHIELDDELCEANGICQKHAPTIFEVTDTDELIIRHEAYSEALREQVEMAIGCVPARPSRSSPEPFGATAMSDSTPFEPRRFRDVMGRFATGVTVITAGRARRCAA